MSALLTWAVATVATKTGTAIGNLFSDMLAAFNAKSGDAAYSWQVASSNVASNPYQITLKPKAGGAGRILIVAWTATPAGNNPSLLETAPNTTSVYVSYFPAGNVDTPSNLTASSGAVMGDDTGCTKVANFGSVATIYQVNYQFNYADSAEAMWFFFQNPAGTTIYGGAAGKIFVNFADDAELAGVVGLGSSTMAWGTSAPIPFTANATLAGSNAVSARVFKDGASRACYIGYSPTGTWASQTIGPNDVLTDTTANKAWFAPIIMMTNQKGGGFTFKVRQFGYGPAFASAYQVYNETGPTPKALMFSAYAPGSTGVPWLLNEKI